MTDRVESIRNLCRRCTLRQLVRRALFVAIAIAVLPVIVRAADQPLTNADVIKLSQAKLAARVIIQAITSASAVSFSLEPNDLIALKTKGVPDEVISAMLDRTTPKSQPSAAPASTTTDVSVIVRIVRGGSEDWPLWSRSAGEGAAVGVLLLPDAAFQTDRDARAAIEAYNTNQQGVLVVGGGRDTFSFYSMDCYRYRADSCNKWDRVQFVGAKWEPPAQVTIPLSATAASISAIAVIRHANGKLELLGEDSWIQNARRINYASCTTRSWATGRIHPGGLTLTASMEIDYRRPLGIVEAACLCPQLTFN